jgi:hypothetical protein
MNRELNPCTDCPFRAELNIEHAMLRSQVEAGQWVPCKNTLRAPADGSFQAKIEAWRQEEECAGARMWRRDRQLPAIAA